ncbi:hypothetical protein BDV38DRAFT_241606 [Aspergillus pseudotamarii]|uniref:Uncharacterized protein n=1 Tax=Aspergillus pseudotamarii TaxID=132259 RepID=A0A5N6T0R8_ASPPS|nr:uncharacterized protein BDV38DRAFT_241606 [Aspergillus pseudotamarii]KAE8139493.1 hypothetical protein BDV38DRAFT_241606 [Aspergillus pseudotamarii]
MIGLRTDIRRTMLFLYPICQYPRTTFASLCEHTRIQVQVACVVTVQLVGTPELTDVGALILCLFLFFSFFPSWTGTFFSLRRRSDSGATQKQSCRLSRIPPLL